MSVRVRLARRAAAVVSGMAADRIVGEPATAHPVAGFGRLLGGVERVTWGDNRGRGLAYAASGLGIGLLSGRRLRSTAAATWIAVAGRSLWDHAAEVGEALERGDLEGARELLPNLVGRDVSGLDAGEMASAVIESLADNTVDAVTAPALWALAGGAPAVLGYRAVNTMDAMVGHRNERYASFGWAAARADDLAGWVPARVTAVLVAVARPRSAPAIVRAVLSAAPAHPSPNAGVAEAAFAAALGLRLGGTVRYGEGSAQERPALHDGRPARPRDIAAAIKLSDDVATLLQASIAVVGVAAATVPLRRRARRHTWRVIPESSTSRSTAGPGSPT